VILVDPPKTYHQADLKWGTATSRSTRSGATSNAVRAVAGSLLPRA